MTTCARRGGRGRLPRVPDGRGGAVGGGAGRPGAAGRAGRPGHRRPPPAAALDPETLARRREILEAFQSLPLKNHFEVLGVEPGCTDADVRRAFAALAKRFHPDAHRDDRLADLHDVLAAVFIRVQEAWEVLGDAKSRASYEARFGVAASHAGGQDGARRAASAPAQPPPPAEDYRYVPPEETLLKAQLLLAQARYWDAIQVLETAIPQMEPGRHQIRGRILLARAYAKNPNWVRKAEEQLQDVVRDDPANVDAHYELGMLYKSGGLPARAQAMFRRALELRPDHREAAAELDREGPGPRRPPQAAVRAGQGLLTGRAALRAALLALAAAGGAVALGPPRLTWENAGLRVDHPPQQGAAAALAAAAAIGASWPARRRAARAAGLALGLALAAFAAHRLAWRVEAKEAFLRERTLAGWNALAWSEVEAVEPSAQAVALRGRGGNDLEVSTRGLHRRGPHPLRAHGRPPHQRGQPLTSSGLRA